MRLVFAGTPTFAATALRALGEAGHEVVGVMTQPDRPAGRGMALQASPVKQLALQQGLPLCQPRSLRLDGRFPDDAAQARTWLQELRPQAMVVAAYGLLLPTWTLALPEQGCLNIHASLLPRWRGAAPIQRAIEAGDAVTGVAIMQMDIGLDTGDVLLEAPEPIHDHDTAATLHDRLAVLGSRLIVQALERLAVGDLSPRPQAVEGVTYAAKIDKAEALIDWCDPAVLIERRVRAFDPVPGAAFEWQGERIKLWRARALTHPLPGLGGAAASADPVQGANPGEVVDLGPGRLAFATGAGVLECLDIQRPGGRRTGVADALRGGLLAGPREGPRDGPRGDPRGAGAQTAGLAGSSRDVPGR
jgi:methionyl-tRNA formyltransferase